MELPTNEEVLSTIEGFLDRHSMAPTRFGALATGEPQLIASIRKGRSPRLNLLHRIKAFMDAKDAELDGGARHNESDTSQSSGASCGSRPKVSGKEFEGFAAERLGSEAAAAEGEGVSTLPGGPRA